MTPMSGDRTKGRHRIPTRSDGVAGVEFILVGEKYRLEVRFRDVFG